MRLSTLFTTAAIVALVSTNVMAQTAAPAATTVPAATTTTTAPAAMTKPATGTMGKMKPMQSDVSKACSAQADAKGLHGKERSKFRSTCKKNGGKAA